MRKIWIIALALLMVCTMSATCALAEEVVTTQVELDVGEESSLDLDMASDEAMEAGSYEEYLEADDEQYESVLSEPDFSDEGALLEASLDDFELSYFDKKKIIGYKGTATDVVIPSGFSITTIGSFAFQNTSITSITLPEGITTIESYAFNDASMLQSITLPSTLVSIGSGAFQDCTNLQSISIPGSVNKIESNTFEGCINLKKATIGSGTTIIDYWAFYNCVRLSEITLPSTLQTLGSGAFRKCTGLESVTIPGSINRISDYSFYDCEKLQSVTIGNGTSIISDAAFENCYNLTSVSLPSTLETIGDWVFAYCKNLISIEIPEGVTTLGNAVFWGCDNLTTVTMPRSVTSIGNNLFLASDNASMRVYYGSYAQQYCDNKNIEYSIIDPPHKHTVVIDEAVAATCTTPGRTEGSHCSDCGEIIVAQQEIPATGHSPVADPAVAPTCTTAGLTEGSHCSVCGTIITPQTEVPATGHTPVTDPGVAATAYAPGLTEGSHCAVCGEILVAQQEIPQIAIHISRNASTTVNVSDSFGIVVDGRTIKSCKSGNKRVASVTRDGVVTAKKAGTAKITITLTNKKKLTLKVKVVNPYAASSVAIAQGRTYTMKVGETLQLNAVLSPETAQSTFAWSSSKKKVASVSPDGVVSALKKGKTKITVKTNNKKKATITINVVN